MQEAFTHLSDYNPKKPFQSGTDTMLFYFVGGFSLIFGNAGYAASPVT